MTPEDRFRDGELLSRIPDGPPGDAKRVDCAGPLCNRPAIGTVANGFVWFATDTQEYWRHTAGRYWARLHYD